MTECMWGYGPDDSNRGGIYSNNYSLNGKNECRRRRYRTVEPNGRTYQFGLKKKQ